LALGCRPLPPGRALRVAYILIGDPVLLEECIPKVAECACSDLRADLSHEPLHET
jgi:hypothetical protein